jgi:hypothetical protein
VHPGPPVPYDVDHHPFRPHSPEGLRQSGHARADAGDPLGRLRPYPVAPLGGLFRDSAGNLYGSTLEGGVSVSVNASANPAEVYCRLIVATASLVVSTAAIPPDPSFAVVYVRMWYA